MFRALPALLVAFVLLAGCNDDGGGDGDGTTTTGPTTTAPPPSFSGVATAVEIVRAPESAAVGGMATVCWTVTGTGQVPHVAIHWDNSSHAAEPARTFQDYNLGASYPNNQSSAASSGYELHVDGSRFCTAATMPASGSIFVVGHVIDSTGAPGKLSSEEEIKVGPASEGSIRIQNFAYSPAVLTVAPGAMVTVQNMDSMTHTVTGPSGAFDTGDVPGGQTRTFTAPMGTGSYTYGCAHHAAMSGVLQVA